MATIDVEIPSNQFSELAKSDYTNLVLPLSLGILKNDTLRLISVNSAGVQTGEQGSASVLKIVDGQFYSLPSDYNQYYLNVYSMYNWIDYSASSTVVGWSSFTTKSIKYCVIGNTLFVNYEIIGTGNANNSYFTLPFTFNTTASRVQAQVCSMTSGTNALNSGVAVVGLTENKIYLVLNNQGSGWPATAGKGSKGQLFIPLQ